MRDITTLYQWSSYLAPKTERLPCARVRRIVDLMVLFLSALLGGMELWAFLFSGDSGTAWIRHGHGVEVYKRFMSLLLEWRVDTALFIILVLCLCFPLFLVKALFLRLALVHFCQYHWLLG